MPALAHPRVLVLHGPEPVPFRIAAHRYRASGVQDWHAHPGSSITFHLSGPIREHTRTAVAASLGAGLSIKPAGVRHRDEFGPAPARTVQVAFGPSLPPWLGVLPGWGWRSDAVATCAGLRFVEAFAARATDAVLSELLLDLLDTVTGRLADARAPGWWPAVRSALDDPDGAPTAELAAHVGVHPVYLARVARRQLGCTVAEHRQRARVTRAARALARGAGISPTAHAVGFADHAHLTRSFRRHTGLTPSRWRTLATG